MGDGANTFSTPALFPFSTSTSTIVSSSTTGSLFQSDMFNQNQNTKTNMNYDYSVKQESFSKFYYFNRFISFFYAFLYDDVSVSSEKLGNNNNANNGIKTSISYQNGNYNYDNKVRDSVYRNKPEKPYHPSENHCLISYQNGGEEDEEEE